MLDTRSGSFAFTLKIEEEDFIVPLNTLKYTRRPKGSLKTLNTCAENGALAETSCETVSSFPGIAASFAGMSFGEGMYSTTNEISSLTPIPCVGQHSL